MEEFSFCNFHFLMKSTFFFKTIERYKVIFPAKAGSADECTVLKVNLNAARNILPRSPSPFPLPSGERAGVRGKGQRG
jgi:hypothetical protein